MPAEKFPRVEPERPSRYRCAVILEHPEAGWSGVGMGEWALAGAAHEDTHPFNEVNFVLEGTLVVTCEGEVVELGEGETVRVSAGSTAQYEAPVYARMLYVYGPNPNGLPSTVLDTEPSARPRPAQKPSGS